MATLYIAEFEGTAAVQGVDGVVGGVPLAQSTVAIAGASAQSAVFSANTRVIRVHTDAICSIDIGSNPTATTSEMRMAANQTEYFGVTPGHKIAVISNT